MIVIPQFREYVAGLADRLPTVSVFIWFLFPDSTPSHPRLNDVLKGPNGYIKASILGFLFAKGDVEKKGPFLSEVGWLMNGNLEARDLMVDPAGLLGLALGLRKADHPDYTVWFLQVLLPLAVRKGLDASLADFFRCLISGKVMDFSVGPVNELSLFSALYDKDPSDLGDASKHLQTYFIRFRKEDFPALPDDYFRSILSVWLVDWALILCPCGEEAVLYWRGKLHGPIELVLSRKASKRARFWAVGAVLLVTGLLVWGGYWFFIRLLNIGDNQLIYDRADLAMEWVGGIGAVAVALGRLLYYLFKGKKLNWEVETIYAYAYPRILGRLRRTFGLEVKGQ